MRSNLRVATGLARADKNLKKMYSYVQFRSTNYDLPKKFKIFYPLKHYRATSNNQKQLKHILLLGFFPIYSSLWIA